MPGACTGPAFTPAIPAKKNATALVRRPTPTILGVVGSEQKQRERRGETEHWLYTSSKVRVCRRAYFA